MKHAGLASKRGRLAAVVAHLADVNGWTAEDAELYLEAVFETWGARSRHQWTLDISLLTTPYSIEDADRSVTHCEAPECGNIVPYDDEPYCLEHSDDSGSYVRGYSYRRKHADES